MGLYLHKSQTSKKTKIHIIIYKLVSQLFIYFKKEPTTLKEL